MADGRPEHDLLLRGGTTLDPGQGIDGPRDIAFRDGRVSAVAERIEVGTAAEVVDVAGRLVAPGLVDLHGHFYHGGTTSAVHADEACLSSGVTTGLDAGSAGIANYGAMRDYVFPAHRVRLLALLHIGAVGLAHGRTVGGELRDLRLIDAEATAAQIRANPGFLFGVKVRMQRDAVAHWDAREALALARKAADDSDSLLMVHVSGTPIPLPEILELLGEGDVVTHAYNGHTEHMLDGHGMVRPEVLAARERGVVMDVGHAGVHFDIEVTRRVIEQGFPPSTISTDVHFPPPGRITYRMHELIPQLHALGMPLEDAVEASTAAPAAVLGLGDEIGSLAPGMAGDAAVFDLVEGPVSWVDMSGGSVEGELRLDPVLTVLGGEVVWRAA
ncbi:MAG: amidohydrolase/deacetylase family metallohydrolase [Chloroflexi bacterium]|nr:amidohydrolase/deacetylase family metallohydrolase [Chloroflexota bacterium]